MLISFQTDMYQSTCATAKTEVTKLMREERSDERGKMREPREREREERERESKRKSKRNRNKQKEREREREREREIG